MVKASLIRLDNRYTAHISKLLSQDEPWNMIAFDAFIRHGLQHPEHIWYGEIKNGYVSRVLYTHHQLLHLLVTAPLPSNSLLYSLINKQYRGFIIHGKKEIVEPFLSGLTQFQGKKIDEANYVQQRQYNSPRLKHQKQSSLQSKQNSFSTTKDLLSQGESLRLRTAEIQDMRQLLRLYMGSSIDYLVDPQLIKELIAQGQVLLAVVKKTNLSDTRLFSQQPHHEKIIGSLMLLKESPKFVLLGGLYVDPAYRKSGVATTLALKTINQINRRKKRICFYFNDPKLKRFYSQIPLLQLGKWVTYTVTSNAVT